VSADGWVKIDIIVRVEVHGRDLGPEDFLVRKSDSELRFQV
jgi:hypothetical protein